MSSATLQITFFPKRMLKKAEAAHLCGRSLKRFEVECPCRPVAFPNGDKRWDVQDLDRWIEVLKHGCDDAESILARLG
jgi:hypothetical protein